MRTITSRRCSLLISKASAKLYQILSRGTKKRRKQKIRKSERVFTFLAPKNQLPFFFLCAKYGPKVNTIRIEYDNKVQQSFLFET